MFTKFWTIPQCSQCFYSLHPSVYRLLNFNGIKSVLSVTVTIPLRIMENAVANQVEVLVRRLSEAERRAKLLKLEVKSIRQEITTMQQSIRTTQSASGNNRLTAGTILIDALPSTSSVVHDPTSNKRQNPDSSEQPQNKKKGHFTKEGEYIVVYTDGACENNGKPNARAGIGVWFGDGHPLNISKPVEGRATNNNAEIQACIEALVVLLDNGGRKIKIFTDSEFTINCMTKWIKNWKSNMWKTAKGEPVKNKQELQVLDKIMSKFDQVKWEHVAGHRGIKGNEEADKLARQGALRYQPPS